MIVGAASLKKVISKQFGSDKKGEKSNYNLDSFSKDLNYAMLII